MNQEQFDSLVTRLETYARANPTGYKVRVGVLAAVGYAYLFAVVLLLLLCVYAVLSFGRINWLVIKVIWIPLVLIGITLRSLWVSFPEPEGMPLRREDAEALFDLVKEVEAVVQSPRVSHILLTDDFNAAVVQIPRLGVFGWQKNYLLVGLPLMRCLTPEQFRSVIAHELGHLSGNHGRFSGWVYRVRQTWVQILVRLQQQDRFGTFVFAWFFNWYAPFFNAYSFVLARAQEYEADAQAVRFAGREHAASALIKVEINGRYLSEEFWPKFYKQADEQAEPPPNVLSQLLLAAARPVPADAARKWFTQALAARTDHHDTHPALKDRLAAMGYDAPELEKVEAGATMSTPVEGEGEPTSAAARYLGAVTEQFLSTRNEWWKEQLGQSWRERHRHVRQARQTVGKLREKAQTQTLSAAEHWDLARNLAETEGPGAALPGIRELLAAHPDHVEGNLACGQILLHQKDGGGIEYVEKAMRLDRDVTMSGCEAIYVYLKENGRDEEAEQYRQRAERHHQATQG